VRGLDLVSRWGQLLRFAQPGAAGGGVELLVPDAPQHRHRRQLAQPRRRLGRVQRRQQGQPVVANRRNERLPLRLPLRQPVLLDAPTVAFAPGGRDVRLRPPRRPDGQRLQGDPHRFGNVFEATQHAQRAEDVGRIGPLPAPRLEQAALGASGQQLVEQQVLGGTGDEAGAELGEDGEVEAGVG
jgi:hypothetical protein